jgi:transcription initiation factor IIE alpha subunit
VDPSAAAAWQVVLDRGSAAEQEIADALPLAIDETRRALDALVGAGIVRRAEGRYLPLTTAA